MKHSPTVLKGLGLTLFGRLFSRVWATMVLGLSLAVMRLVGGGDLYAAGITTNDLRLAITRLPNATVNLAIHTPLTNGVYDLYFRTNFNLNPSFPFNWQWARIQRAAPGQTNLVVTNSPPARGFFRLGPLTNAIRPGFDQQFLVRNDDNEGVTNLLAALGFAINFFGTAHTNLYVNNNGNVTFDAPYDSYTPVYLGDLGRSVIAPFWADVDTVNPGSDVVRYGNNVVEGRNAFAAEWVNVGYFNQQVDKLLSCQLVIIDRLDIAPGDFDMEFNYDRVEWESASASKGYFARSGFAGVTNYYSHSYELPGSGIAGAFLDTNFDTGLIYHSMDGPRTNLTVNPVSGRYRFFFRNGWPLP